MSYQIVREQRSTGPLHSDPVRIRAADHGVSCVHQQLQALFTMMTAVFDAYVLIEAEPGKDHFGYYVISFEFVYAGNPHGEC